MCGYFGSTAKVSKLNVCEFAEGVLSVFTLKEVQGCWGVLSWTCCGGCRLVGVLVVEILNRDGSILEVASRFPGVFTSILAFPVDQVL